MRASRPVVAVIIGLVAGLLLLAPPALGEHSGHVSAPVMCEVPPPNTVGEHSDVACAVPFSVDTLEQPGGPGILAKSGPNLPLTTTALSMLALGVWLRLLARDQEPRADHLAR